MATGFILAPFAENQERFSSEDLPREMISALFREHYRRVLLAAYRITGSMADAEDVAQAVFLRLTTGRRAPETNAGSYLYRAAINGALDLLRQRKSTMTESLDLSRGTVEVADGSSPESDLQRRQLSDALRLAISELTPRVAEMVTLRYIEEIGNQEIASLMGTSQAVVAVTLFKARARLKKRLKDLDEEKQ